MVTKNSKIFLAGHNGMAGTALLNKLKYAGYKKIFTIDKKKLDLLIPLRNKTRLTFSNEMLLNIEMICSKLLGEIDKRRRILEKELENFIPIKEIGIDNFDFPFNIES